MAARSASLLKILFLLGLVSASLQQYFFENTPYVANVEETETAEVNMGCVSCNIQERYAVYLDRIRPACNNCFQIYNLTAAGAGSNQWCAYYIPGQLDPGLAYNEEHVYDLSLTCRNDDGTKSSSTEFQVRLRRNQQAVFDETGDVTTTWTFQSNVDCASETRDFQVSDAEGDDITCGVQSVSPASAFDLVSFSRPATNGPCQLSCDGVLRSVCADSLSAVLTVTDDKHTSPNTKTVNINLRGRDYPKCSQGCNTTHYIEENAVVGGDVATLAFNPNPDSIAISWDRSAAASLYRYDEADKQFKVISGLDYDNLVTRTATATVTLRDEYCPAPPYYVTFVITDFNYPPEVECVPGISQYEQDFSVGPVITITDRDRNDRHSMRTVGSSFCRATSKDDLQCNGYDFDTGANNGTIFVKMNVSDNSALGARYVEVECPLQIKDRNDNPPRFENPAYTFEITNCTEPSQLTPSLNVTDLDSEFQDNNLVTVNQASHGCGTVLGDGSVYVTSFCPVGVHTLTTTATDHGQFPGPLTSAPVTVTFVVTVCPTTPVPTVPPTAAPVTPVATTPTPTTTTTTTTTPAPTTAVPTAGVAGGGTDTLLAWLIPLLLLGLLAAGLSALLCYRYCCQARPKQPPALRNFQPNNRFHTPPKSHVAPATPSEVKPTLKATQRVPTPPRPPTPQRFVTPMSPSPHKFNFWQESYPDADYVKQPNRGALPATDTF